MHRLKPREKLLLLALLAALAIFLSQNLADELNFRIQNLQHSLANAHAQSLNDQSAYAQTLEKINNLSAKIQHQIDQLTQTNEQLNAILSHIYSTAPSPLSAIEMTLKAVQAQGLHASEIKLAMRDSDAILLKGSGKFSNIAAFMADTKPLLENFTDIDFALLKRTASGIEFEFLTQDLRAFQNLGEFQNLNNTDSVQNLRLDSEIAQASPACTLQCVQNLQAALNAPYSHILITHDPFAQQPQSVQIAQLQGIFNGRALINDELYDIGSSPFFEILEIANHYIVVQNGAHEPQKIQVGEEVEVKF